MSKTRTSPNPDGGAPLRINVSAILCDAQTGHVFVGKLLPREEDKRRYTCSTVEGGLDEGETLASTFAREIAEEVGIEDVIFLTALRNPIICLFDEEKGPQKYSGKLSYIAFFAVKNRAEINLDSGRDPEGPTFESCVWLEPAEAKKRFIEGTSSAYRKSYLSEIYGFSQNIPPIMAHLRQKGEPLSAATLVSLLPSEIYSSTLPETP